jgi:hypothetical protein
MTISQKPSSRQCRGGRRHRQDDKERAELGHAGHDAQVDRGDDRRRSLANLRGAPPRREGDLFGGGQGVGQRILDAVLGQPVASLSRLPPDGGARPFSAATEVPLWSGMKRQE